jgi:pyrroloquinoline quinone biosynthesis protein A
LSELLLQSLDPKGKIHYTSLWLVLEINFKREIIMWTTPAATEMRFGFEVTMYVMNK